MTYNQLIQHEAAQFARAWSPDSYALVGTSPTELAQVTQTLLTHVGLNMSDLQLNMHENYFPRSADARTVAAATELLLTIPGMLNCLVTLAEDQG